MKKFSSCFFRYILPVSILACTISSTVKPMENITDQENTELANLSIKCNFKEFQLKVLNEKLGNEVKKLANEGHIVALWTKLIAWDGKLNKLSKSAEVDEFFTDLMNFFVILGVNCAQYYNFTDNHEQAQYVYDVFKNYIIKTFEATIGAVAASSTLDYTTCLNNSLYWVGNSFSDVMLPSCGWVAHVEIVWNKTGIFSGGFYTVQSNDFLKINQFGSIAACELAQLHFSDLNQAFIKTIAKNKTWVEFINSKGDLIDALHVAAQSISRSVQALKVIKTQNQELKEWEKLSSLQDEIIFKRDQKILESDNQLRGLQLYKDINSISLNSVKTKEKAFDLNKVLEAKKQERFSQINKDISEFKFENLKIATTKVNALSGKEMYEQEKVQQHINESISDFNYETSEIDQRIEIIEQKLIEMDIVEETPITEQNK